MPPVQPSAIGEVVLALHDVARHDVVEQGEPAVRNASVSALPSTKSRTGSSSPVTVRSCGVVVRVGQEAHVHHDVGVDRQAVLEAEATRRVMASVLARLGEGTGRGSGAQLARA